MPSLKQRFPINDDDIICIDDTALAQNPKRAGTAAYRKFAFLCQFDGQSVHEFESAASQRKDLGQPFEVQQNVNWACGELQWCLNRGFISLQRPGKAPKGDASTCHSMDAMADHLNGGWSRRRDRLPTTYRFEVGATYTRRDVFRILGIADPGGGSWYTGYNRHGDDWFIFCGVHTAGRTGHNYHNYFAEGDLVWFGKTGSHKRQPSIQNLLNPGGTIYIFYRHDDRSPFIFAGIARAKC